MVHASRISLTASKGSIFFIYAQFTEHKLFLITFNHCTWCRKYNKLLAFILNSQSSNYFKYQGLHCQQTLMIVYCYNSVNSHKLDNKREPMIYSVQQVKVQNECRTKHPTDKTPHVHFGICGQKPPHVFFKADKTPHAQ